MRTTNIRRGCVVYDVADPRHHGIVRSLHLRNGRKNGHAFFANVQWIDTGWRSHRVPVANLRLVAEEEPERTEYDLLRSATNQRSKRQ